MKSKILGLACFASLAALGTAQAVETELQVGPDEFRVGGELLNKHYSHGRVIHPDVTSHGSLDFRWYDVGIHLDGYIVLDGAPGPRDTVINDFEMTEVTGRLDYRSWETEGNKHSKVEIIADEVAPSLRWATASITKNERREGGGGGFGGGGGQAPPPGEPPAYEDEEPF